MREHYLQTKIVAGRFSLSVTIVITTACWLISYFFIPDIPGREKGYSILGLDLAESLPVWSNQTISYVFHLLTGFFLIWLNNAFGLIRVKATIQTSAYLLFISAVPVLHLLYAGDVAAICMLFSIYYLFSCYQEQRPEKLVFLSFLFLGLGSLVFPQLMFFIPLWWVGMFFFKSLYLRSFMASAIGWGVPYWFLFSYAYCTGQMALFYYPFTELTTYYPITLEYLKTWEVATLVYCLILFIASLIHVFANGYKDKMRIQFYLYFLLLTTFGILIFIFLQPVHFTDLLSLLLVGISIPVGHMFALTNSRGSNLFFVFAITGLIALFCINVWMLL